MAQKIRLGLITLALVLAACCTVAASSAASSKEDSRSMGQTEQNSYVGSASCAKCHVRITQAQIATPMAKAVLATKPGPDSIDYSQMSYHEGSYTTHIERHGDNLDFTVSQGPSSATAEIRWIFGQGIIGQTFLLAYKGKYYESRASYYSAIKNLDITVGHPHTLPATVEAALGRPLPPDEVQKCFQCHTSEDVFVGKLDLTKAHPGISCENCHGPGSSHIAAMSAGEQNTRIFNPAKLAPDAENDFCGECHRTTRDVLELNIRDIRNVRFQPYRLENSRCYDPTDARITCVACHDPHRNLVRDAASYDAQCLACHRNGTQKPAKGMAAAACLRETHNCVTCHMPRQSMPGSHFTFTDHYIRINHPEQGYPG